MKLLATLLIAGITLAQTPAPQAPKAARQAAVRAPASTPSQLKYPPLRAIEIPDATAFTDRKSVV